MRVDVNVPEQENAREVNTATVSKATVPLDGVDLRSSNIVGITKSVEGGDEESVGGKAACTGAISDPYP
jgi:hypothetical protein